MITRPSLRFLRALRKALPHVDFSVDWKYRVWITGGIGLIGGVIFGIVVLFL